ncbi:MAG: helix-turn-helix transcriptional regulator [Oscillospiraceae bacterium]|nr:helix-turn-helix transcriptional regulator [Candidatus Ruminococcus equi]
MEFKDKVIYVRKELIMSQQELADALGVNVATINRIERGTHKPGFKTLALFERFCKTKGIELGEEK